MKLTRRAMVGAGAGLGLLSSRAHAAGQIFTVIGTGVAGSAIDDEPLKTARINNHFGVLFGSDGLLLRDIRVEKRPY